MATRGTPEVPAEPYPGQRLGLPESGRGSLAGWRARVAALIVDWAASMAVAVGIFGTVVVTGSGWQAWMILATFFVETTLLVTVASGSFGQLICRIAVVRLDTEPVGFPRAALRQALICLALPPLIIGPDRRGLQDLVATTVVVNRR
ncbi:RDD family protein [Microlunatus aurantiacus]|uniref:RDD family protein n=1 Tax=Microlunatus aurantiacus TaxID=446786 RepID=A0ABP7DUQ1_9ACTN